MTRPGKAQRATRLAELFTSDPLAAALGLIKDADRGLKASEIKEALRVAGTAKADTDRQWPTLQKRIKTHEHIEVGPGHRYAWISQPRPVAPLDAFERLLRGRLATDRKAVLAAVVRVALSGGAAELEQEARLRQAEIDAIRGLAELASEVEELTANEVESSVMIRQVRAWVKRSGLEPIDQAGEETTFDRKRHKPIGPPIRDGATVVVVRPGYVWKSAHEDLLIGKAVVEE